jgi:hypothetical protein
MLKYEKQDEEEIERLKKLKEDYLKLKNFNLSKEEEIKRFLKVMRGEECHYMLVIIFPDCEYNIALYDDMIIKEEVDKIENLMGTKCLYYEVRIK